MIPCALFSSVQLVHRRLSAASTPLALILLLCLHVRRKTSGICFSIVLEIHSSSHVFYFFILSSKPTSSLQFYSQMKYTRFLVENIFEQRFMSSFTEMMDKLSLKLPPPLTSVVSPFVVFLLPL